jgi:hypothetical protein
MKRNLNKLVLGLFIMKFYNCFLIVIICMFSCKNNSKHTDFIGSDNNANTLMVSLNMDDDQKIDLTEFIDSVRFIRLETNDECLIGRIQNVIYYDGIYYIQDNFASSVFAFDETGKFIFKICKKGRGPGEYIKISRLLIDYSKNRLLIYDNEMRKMIYYTLDGNHIKDIHHFSDKAMITDIILLSDGSFLCYEPFFLNKYWGVWKVDSTGKFNEFLWKQKNKYPYTYHQYSSYFYELRDNNVGLWCADYNDIIHFSHNSAYKYLSMHINMKTSTDYPGYDWRSLPNKTLMTRTNVIEKDNFIITWWWNHDQHYSSSLYLKNEKKAIVSRGIDFGEDVIFGEDINFNCTDRMLQIINADMAEYMLNDDYMSNRHKDMLKTMFSDKEENNPVLEVIYLKK